MIEALLDLADLGSLAELTNSDLDRGGDVGGFYCSTGVDFVPPARGRDGTAPVKTRAGAAIAGAGEFFVVEG